MADNEVTTTENAVEEKFETPSFAEALTGTFKKGGAEKPEVEASATETEVPATETPAPVVEAQAPAAEPVKTEAPVVAAAAPEMVEETPGNRMVPVGALKAEREKRQIAEALLAEREAMQVQPEPVYQDAEPVDPQYQALNNKFLAQSEKAARRAHADFEPAYAAFLEAIKTNDELRKIVIASDDPGEAAYQTGKNFLIQKKYGLSSIGDLEGFRTAIEKEAREDERKKVTAEFQANLTAKAAERSKTTTDITAGRAAGGSTESEWVQPSFHELLGSVHRKR